MYRKLSYLGVAALLLSVTAVSTRAAFNPNTDPALVAWYEFEGNAKDSSPNVLHGTEHGGPTYAPGVYGKAVEMDGQNDYIDCGRDPKFDITAQITFAYWIKVRAFDREWNTVFAKGDNSYRSSRADFNMFMEAAVGGTSGNYLYAVTPVNDNKWHHVACVYDGKNFVIYIDGKQDAIEASTGSIAVSANNVYIGDNSGATGRFWNGWIDDLRIYKRAFAPDEVKALLTISKGTAEAPVPADKATDVPRDASLSWTPGPSAGTHDVYLGTTIADVNAAGRTDKKGVLASQGQAGTTFDPAGVFTYGQTYYWRIDEVNKTPDNTIFKGNVWSFTVEPFGYAMKPAKVTASSSQAGMGPEKTIDGTGLTADLHGTEPTTMWMSAGAKPNWIQYEFDKPYKLYQLLVWNSNQLIEGFLGFGAKSVAIETSVDGTTWMPLANVPEFGRGPGAPDYAANTTVNLGGMQAKFVKLTIDANWGGMAPQTGLAEVRFSYIPVQARLPEPATAATGVSIDADLNWRPGREAGSHSVSFGTDPNTLGAAKKVTDHSFDPGSMNFGTKYYWKVDEVNTVTYPGEVWSFTTQEYKPIDDFESYTDQAGGEIFTAWVDGYATGLNGSTVGNDTAAGGTFGETAIIHGGKQSMPMVFDNSKSPFYSEATQTFASLQDWTGNGANTLSLWVRGQPAAFVDKGNGGFTVGASGHDIWDAADDFRFVYKKLSGDGSIVVKVDSLVGSTNLWSKAGVMIRTNLTDGSPMVDMVIANPDGANGANFQWRVSAGANASSTNSPSTPNIKTPQWVKLTRKGNVFSGQYSADGVTWLDIKNPALTGTPVTTTVNMPGDVYIGLCLTSHDRVQTAIAEFSGAATTGNVSGAWEQAWIGDDPDLTMDLASLYVIVEDSTGKSATATNATIANATAWTQWSIPFSDLTGVSLAKVKKLTIGVGNKATPKAGGTGTVYIDDIGYGRPVK